MKISLEKTGSRSGVDRIPSEMCWRGSLIFWPCWEALNSHPFLRGKLALKGGTALNLFLFDVPRLSVDIDLNYVGSESRDGMLKERPQIEEAMRAAFGREDFEVDEAPREHAGGKWHLRYAASTGQRSGIDVDLNYMLRVPLWPVIRMDSHSLAGWQAGAIPVVDIHELAAGKLAALLARRKARDLFDGSLLFSIDGLDIQRLRTAFVVYGAMNRKDWRTVSAADVVLDEAELHNQLLPALRIGQVANADAISYGNHLVDECRERAYGVAAFQRRRTRFSQPPA